MEQILQPTKPLCKTIQRYRWQQIQSQQLQRQQFHSPKTRRSYRTLKRSHRRIFAKLEKNDAAKTDERKLTPQEIKEKIVQPMREKQT
jgi:hypothetical protein